MTTLRKSETAKIQTNTEPFIHTLKEMAAALERSERFVADMKSGGFQLPATLSEAVEFLRKKGPPTRFRLYSHEKKS